MGYDEMMLANHQRETDRAEAEAEADEFKFDEWRRQFRAIAKTADPKADSLISSHPFLADVYNEAISDMDQVFNEYCLRTLLLLANKGQIEAVEWLSKFEDKYTQLRDMWT